MNNVVLVGNLTKKPEIVETKENMLTKFTIAVTREFNDKETDFFNVSAWNKLAEICNKYLDKGNKVAVIGRLRNNTYEDKDGIKRTSTEVVAERVEFFNKKFETVEREENEDKPERPVLTPINDNDLPF